MIDNIRSEINSTPNPDFDNLSAADMHDLLYNSYAENSILQFRSNISSDIFENIGFHKLVYFLLQRISEKGEVAVTKLKNLNTKLVTEIYLQNNFTGEEVFELSNRKTYRQEDILSLQNSMIIINNILKLTKVNKTKLTLTKKGKSIIDSEDHNQLLRIVFQAYFESFNWGYHDGYAESWDMQQCSFYTLYLLLQYGDEERKVSFYSDKLLLAFPDLMEAYVSRYFTSEKSFENALKVRFFERFLNWFHFVEIRPVGGLNSEIFVKNKLIPDVLKIVSTNYKFRKSAFNS